MWSMNWEEPTIPVVDSKEPTDNDKTTDPECCLNEVHIDPTYWTGKEMMDTSLKEGSTCKITSDTNSDPAECNPVGATKSTVP